MRSGLPSLTKQLGATHGLLPIHRLSASGGQPNASATAGMGPTSDRSSLNSSARLFDCCCAYSTGPGSCSPCSSWRTCAVSVCEEGRFAARRVRQWESQAYRHALLVRKRKHLPAITVISHSICTAVRGHRDCHLPATQVLMQAAESGDEPIPLQLRAAPRRRQLSRSDMRCTNAEAQASALWRLSAPLAYSWQHTVAGTEWV